MENKLIDVLERQLRIIYDSDLSDPVAGKELLRLNEEFRQIIEEDS